MKLMRIVCFAMILTLTSSAFAVAKQDSSIIFLGEILEVQKGDNDKSFRLLVEGYINDSEIYKDKIVTLVNEKTEIKTNSEEGAEKVQFRKGDKVYVIFNGAMTKSVPPQGTAKMIQVSGNP
ncbi:MAG: hypothetical protein AB6733_19850 [Clostridiaceae bacterium]